MLPDSVLASVLTVAIQGLNAPYGAPCFLTVDLKATALDGGFLS